MINWNGHLQYVCNERNIILLYIFKLPFYKEILNDYAYIYLTFPFFQLCDTIYPLLGGSNELDFKKNSFIGIIGKHGKV